MKNLIPLIALVATLTACSSVRETLGLQAQAGPDEFDVATAPPLAIPPDFTLRPPQPGAPRPQAVNPQETAKDILLGSNADVSTSSIAPENNTQNNTQNSAQSSAEQALLDNINAPAAETAAAATTADGATDRLQAVLQAPITPNQAGKLPTIEMEEKGGFWDSWF